MTKLKSFATILTAGLVGLWSSITIAQFTINGTEIIFPDASTQSVAAASGSSLLRTINVSPTPGDTTASGTAFRTAYDAIGDASAVNPYVVLLEPGVYDIGSTALNLRPYVNLRGTSRESTIIQSSYSGGLTVGAIDAETVTVELSSFTLSLTATNNAAGIWCYQSQMLIEDVNVTYANSITGTVYGVATGNSSSNLKMRNCQITIPTFGASTTVIGFKNEAGNANLAQCEIILNESEATLGATRVLGVDNRSGTGTTNLRNCRVIAHDDTATNAHALLASTGNINAGSTELFGSVLNFGATGIKVVGCWDSSFDPITDG